MADSPPAGREESLAAAPAEGTAILEQSEAGEWAIYNPEEALPQEVQQRLAVIQMLMAVKGTDRYGKMQQRAAQKLGVSLRSVQRLMQAWQAEGLAGLTRRTRSDEGTVRVSEEWRQFIVKTYREGNRGSRRLSAAQVFIRVKVRAAALGEREYPSRPTVYRILKPYREKRQRKRALGWRGERLSLKTREGLEISVEWSNQVWQADHTKVDVLVADRTGVVLGRPWLSTVVDTYSRCIMGIHLGFDAPSAAVVCLALRHAILPKQYRTHLRSLRIGCKPLQH